MIIYLFIYLLKKKKLKVESRFVIIKTKCVDNWFWPCGLLQSYMKYTKQVIDLIFTVDHVNKNGNPNSEHGKRGIRDIIIS